MSFEPIEEGLQRRNTEEDTKIEVDLNTSFSEDEEEEDDDFSNIKYLIEQRNSKNLQQEQTEVDKFLAENNLDEAAIGLCLKALNIQSVSELKSPGKQ